MDLDEVAHHEPPHLNLCCLQIQLFLSLVLKELMEVSHDGLGLLVLKKLHVTLLDCLYQYFWQKKM